MILLVDDERSLLKTLRAAMEDRGFEVAEATNGAQAYGLLKSPDCDGMLLDINMPEVDGLELLAVMKDDGIEIPTIVMTGDEHFDRSRLDDFPQVAGFLTKPFSYREAIELLQQHVEERVRVCLVTPGGTVTGEARLARGTSLQQALESPARLLTLFDALVEAPGIEPMTSDRLLVRKDQVVCAAHCDDLREREAGGRHG